MVPRRAKCRFRVGDLHVRREATLGASWDLGLWKKVCNFAEMMWIV